MEFSVQGRLFENSTQRLLLSGFYNKKREPEDDKNILCQILYTSLLASLKSSQNITLQHFLSSLDILYILYLLQRADMRLNEKCLSGTPAEQLRTTFPLAYTRHEGHHHLHDPLEPR
jgi:hypothetical protein